ncbi:ABC transporter permease [Dactylosporangium fulvum]|uniref:ABC transporter permease n=1 Tax=Dactylosporangium fulvum TaxID=53359 RepID=A0ABY5VN81_9ACTN|nr:ABC transporter permease [Dactylosporangium fulvum]UWP79118.1 ABC transporter permease [Dactylosporangium fulvum]
MLWLTWRQHRAELLVAALFLALVAVPLLVTGVAMHDEYRTGGVAACVADPAAHTGCGPLVDRFLGRYREWGSRLMWAALLPAVVGVFVGAPLLARELEQGTWRLAFTQSVSRTRWLLTKLALVGAGVAVFTAAFAALCTWWRGPLDAIGGRLRSASFLVAVPSLTSAALCAFAVGVLAGVLLRRTVVAMGATLVVFLTARLSMEEYLRPHYREPLVRITDPATRPEATDTGASTDWIVHNSWIDRTGHLLSADEEAAAVRQVYGGTDAVRGSGTPMEQYLLDHGLRHYTEYHPDSGFWTFQLVETACFLGAAALLLAATVMTIRRRA